MATGDFVCVLRKTDQSKIRVFFARGGKTAPYNCVVTSGEQMKAACASLCAILLACTGIAQAQSPPTIAKSFSAPTVGLNSSVTLTFTITNPNPATDLTGVSFNDNIPVGLIIANPDSMTGSCDPGVISTAPDNINMVGAVVLANSSCTFAIDVLAVAVGNQVNTTDPVTSNEGGTGGTATASVEVVTPDLTITKTHTGNFVRPQTGTTYTITVSNAGIVDTTSLITMNDSLPPGLTATGISGPNWNCTLSPLQCTRGDVLFAGTSFEPITLTVNVGANAASSVTNTATVSGGGDSNTANNTASDVTQVDAALVISALASSLTVAAGSSTSTMLNVNYNGALGAVTFACSGLPAATTCAFNPASVSAAGATSVMVTIATTARSTTVVTPEPQAVPPLLTELLALMGFAALMFAFTATKKRWLRLPIGLAGLALLLAGCGSNSTPVPGSKGLGTPVGTSAVIVTASSASGGATASSTINLMVQ
jgi:uncharacterized repeat protein (TIGR01451 family)